MSPIADPRARLQAVLALTVAGALAVVALAGWWAIALPRPAPLERPATLPTSPAAVATSTIQAASWHVTLWRPLSDAPIVQAAPPVPVKLFSVLKRGGEWIAAVDAGDGRLRYVRAGESVGGNAVVAVDARGIEVRSDGVAQRLELGQ